MELPYSLVPLLHHSSLSPSDLYETDSGDTLSAWSWDRLERLKDRHLIEQVFGQMVNEMGKKSAHAQALGAVITSMVKFTRSSDRIYLHCTLPNTVNGILRVGEKKLFIRDEAANIKEITPSCVLDFYVSESKQRSGYGRQLFEFMLSKEKTNSPAKYGYDRPSPKLLAFLAKYYGLSSYVPQNNNFVVFRKYFSKDLPTTNWQDERKGPQTTVPPPPRTFGKPTGGNSVVNSPRQIPSTSAQPTAQQSNSRQPSVSFASHQSSTPSQPSRMDYAAFAQMQQSPPPGQAAFPQYELNDQDGQALQFDEYKSESNLSRPRDSPTREQFSSSSSYQAQSSPQQPPSGSSAARTYFEEPTAAANAYRRATPPEGQSRLARAGSNVLSTSNLLQSPQSKPTASSHYQSTSQSAYQPSPAKNKNDYNPNLRTTQYHQHNIITGYQHGTGHSSFANQKPPAQFLPDGMTVPQEIPIERKVKHSGIQPRPLLDPAPNGLREVDTRIEQLERSLKEKEAALLAKAQYQIPYRQPDEHNAYWSKSASYQKQTELTQQGQNPTSYSTATGQTEKESAYTNPAHSTRVGGAQNIYSNPVRPPPVAQRSPFAYSAVGRR